MSIQRNWTLEEVVGIALTIKEMADGKRHVRYNNLSGYVPAGTNIDTIRENFLKNYEAIEKLTEWRAEGANYQLTDTAFERYLS